MMKKYNFKQSSFGEKFNEIYFASLDKQRETKEYKENAKKIELYKNILKNNYSVNPEIIEEFVSLIEEKVESEYETAIKNIVDYIDKNNKFESQK